MADPKTQPQQFNWRLLPYAVVGAIIVMLSLFARAGDPVLDYIFLIVPVVCLCCLCCLVVLVVAALRKRPSRSLSVLFALVAFLIVSGAFLRTQGVLRPSLRWLLWSHRFKAEVLAQPTSTNGQLKHIEWDGWGGAPLGDWTAYVVYDPTDSLSVAAKHGRWPTYKRLQGIPCEIDSVRRLESHWYSVVLGMNEWWDRCGTS